MFAVTSLISAVICVATWFSHCHFTELRWTVEFILLGCSLGGSLIPSINYIYIFLAGYLASTRLPIAGNWRATKMALYVDCTSHTNYLCLSCNKTICNKSAECWVPADEKTTGWKMVVSVAFCLLCSKGKQRSDNLGGQGSTKLLLAKETKFPAVSRNAKLPSTLSTEPTVGRKCLTLREKIEDIQLSGTGGISTRKQIDLDVARHKSPRL